MASFPRVAALTLALAASLAPAAARANCRTTTCDPTLGECTKAGAPGCYTGGKPLFWPSKCIGWSAQVDAVPGISLDQFRTTAAAAFGTWAAVTCNGAGVSVSFSDNGDVTCKQVEFDQDKRNAHILMFRSDSWPYTSSVDTIALTTVTFDRDTGEILDVDMEMNAFENTFTVGDSGVQADLQSIITHEAGHFIGFSHSSVPTATMYPAYSKGTTSLRKLDADDVAIACEAYPPARTAQCTPTPYGGFSADCLAMQTASGAGGSGGDPFGSFGGMAGRSLLGGAGATGAGNGTSGCGCRVADAPPPDATSLFALGAVALLARRRRRA
jgi:MYXO-CTERM domain-containing protein